MASREDALTPGFDAGGAGASSTLAQNQGGTANAAPGSEYASGIQNVGQTERWISAIGGGALALYGLTRGSLGGVALAVIGGALIHRGTTGHCNLYEATGINTAEGSGLRSGRNVSVPAERGIKLEKSINISREPAELYRFWRNFENLPRFMNHLESVTVTGEGRSHWVAKAPAGTSVEWDAETYNEKENELIAWRTLEGADVASAGSVRFESAPAGGTVVRVSLKYDPPGGSLGAAVARLFGENPEQQIEEDLHRFKQLMETGDTAAATGGQSSGRGAGGQ